MGCAAAGRGQRWRVRPCSRGWAAQRQRDGAAALGRPAVVGWRSCRRHAVRARCGQDSRWFVGPAGVMVGPCGSVDESGHCGREWAIVDESGPLWTRVGHCGPWRAPSCNCSHIIVQARAHAWVRAWASEQAWWLAHPTTPWHLVRIPEIDLAETQLCCPLDCLMACHSPDARIELASKHAGRRCLHRERSQPVCRSAQHPHPHLSVPVMTRSAERRRELQEARAAGDGGGLLLSRGTTRSGRDLGKDGRHAADALLYATGVPNAPIPGVDGRALCYRISSQVSVCARVHEGVGVAGGPHHVTRSLDTWTRNVQLVWQASIARRV